MGLLNSNLNNFDNHIVYRLLLGFDLENTEEST